MSFKNPIWLKLIIYLGILFFAAFAIAFIYFSYHAITNSKFLQIVIYAFGALLFLYMTYIGIGLNKYINVEISLDDNGVTVSNDGSINKYLWGEIDRIKNSKHIQIYAVYNKSGQPIFLVDHMIPGFSELKDFIENKTSI